MIIALCNKHIETTNTVEDVSPGSSRSAAHSAEAAACSALKYKLIALLRLKSTFVSTCGVQHVSQQLSLNMFILHMSVRVRRKYCL